MPLFLVLYISIYLLMHGYAFYHVHRSLQSSRAVIGLLAVFSLFMVLSPIIVRVAERNGFETGPRMLAYAGYSWMGILFLFIMVAAFFDLFATCKWCLLKLQGKPAEMSKQYLRHRLYAQLVFVLAIYGYGLYEANQITPIHLTIATPKLSPETEKVRIVQISDVHLGLIVREKRLAKILEKVTEAKPDLLVSTGDLVDGQLNDLSGVVQMFKQIDPPFGKIAVTGNHEFYAGLEESLNLTRQAGFVVLRNEVYHGKGVTFVGVDDQTAERFGGEVGQMESQLLRKQKRGRFTILLKHRPVVGQKSVGLFDLQLSGHTHKGQIFPFNVFTWLSYRFRNGINMLEYGYLYISNGSGTWGPPIRFGAQPEVTVIDIIPEINL